MTEFLTSGVLPQVGNDAELMYLGAVAELLQSMSTDIKEKVVMSVLQHGNTAGPQPVVAGPSIMMQRCRPDRLLNVQQSQLQAIAAIAGHSGTAQHHRNRELLQDYHIECRILLRSSTRIYIGE